MLVYEQNYYLAWKVRVWEFLCVVQRRWDKRLRKYVPLVWLRISILNQSVSAGDRVLILYNIVFTCCGSCLDCKLIMWVCDLTCICVLVTLTIKLTILWSLFFNVWYILVGKAIPPKVTQPIFVILTYVCKLWTLKYYKILSLRHIRYIWNHSDTSFDKYLYFLVHSDIYGIICKYLYFLVQTIHGIIRILHLILDTIWGSAHHLLPDFFFIRPSPSTIISHSGFRVRLIYNGIISFHFIFLVMRKIHQSEEFQIIYINKRYQMPYIGNDTK